MTYEMGPTRHAGAANPSKRRFIPQSTFGNRLDGGKIASLKGKKVSLNEIIDLDISIEHRDKGRLINRQVYDGSSGGGRLSSDKSQVRAGYNSHPE